MSAILLIFIVFTGYLVAYHTYGRHLGRKIFRLSAKNRMPSESNFDGIDYVPTPKRVVFGHHFTTIAGLGPIVGPAIGIIWGWLPALLWIFFGSIFMGSVHDFSTLIISARKKGKTIGDLTGEIIGPGAMFAFQLIIQLLLIIVLSVFALIVSTLFILYPEAVLSVWLQVPIAILLGRYMGRGKGSFLFSVLALLMMYVSIFLGVTIPVDLSSLPFLNAILENYQNPKEIITIIWCVILFIYVFIASTLPVQTLLQPRDYINALQLFLALFIIVISIIIVNPELSAPAINSRAFTPSSDVPGMAPVLFIIIACGAISGFHSIASSGTTVKQVKNEKDTLLIGYGSMLSEGFLAVIVLVCIAAGLGLSQKKDSQILEGAEAYYKYYSTWAGATTGISAKLQSFIIGASNLISRLGISDQYIRPLLASFYCIFRQYHPRFSCKNAKISPSGTFWKK